MQDLFAILKKSPLFGGLKEEEIHTVLNCLNAQEKSYPKGSFILHLGERAESIGLLLHGRAHVVQEDFWGNRNLVTELTAGQVFAESYACTPGSILQVGVLAAELCDVLFLDAQRLLTLCASGCAFHTRLIHNLVNILAQKNLLMNEKLTHMGQRTTRQKLLSYLSAEAQRHGGAEFDVPFNRQQLADYLSVDRSAMSAELCKMRDEGLLRFRRSHFVLVDG